ncbi:MAG TPA: ATP synthase subunit I [Alicycliphilus sp.]|nr:ATP synthase subunit I [Alicycliphilus sp.]HRN64249.1 ATP synthase subunit I [Alicycliphilus sp.]HRO52171.1 ATP synthase subunit I [Alicycliphilus sp.]HRP21564.1 ATP synthase subunit I [Alicycliphilus sp.]
MAQASTREKVTASEAESEVEDSDFKPLTAQQAQEWRDRQPPLSVWRIVVMQALVGVVVALLAWWLTGRLQVAWSAGYGALSVVLPAALFARGMARKRTSAGAAMAGLMGWELVKIALTVAMLAAAPRLVPGLSWLALLAGMVITMKTYWIALLARPGVRRTD